MGILPCPRCPGWASSDLPQEVLQALFARIPPQDCRAAHAAGGRPPGRRPGLTPALGTCGSFFKGSCLYALCLLPSVCCSSCDWDPSLPLLLLFSLFLFFFSFLFFSFLPCPSFTPSVCPSISGCHSLCLTPPPCLFSLSAGLSWPLWPLGGVSWAGSLRAAPRCLSAPLSPVSGPLDSVGLWTPSSSGLAAASLSFPPAPYSAPLGLLHLHCSLLPRLVKMSERNPPSPAEGLSGTCGL